MNTEIFSEAMGKLDDRYIHEAIHYHRKKAKRLWVKGVSIAACLVLTAVLGTALLRGGLAGRNTDSVTLENGDIILFVPSDTVGNALSLAVDVTSRELTEEETHALFGDLPVKASVVFTADADAADNSQRIIGFEGKIGDIKLTITTSDIPLRDTVIEGCEKSTVVGGVSVTAGYFVTDPNSTGEQTAIYYAAFELGGSTIYVENSGKNSNREAVKYELAGIVQKLIRNGELELTIF